MVSSTIPFSGSLLDRAGNHRRDGAWLKAQLGAETSRFLLLHELKPLIALEGGARLAWFPQRYAAALADCPTLLLGLENGVAHFAIDVDAVPGIEGLADEQNKFIDVRSIAPQLSLPEAAILAQARSMTDWHRRHRFCAQCGAPSNAEDAGYSRRCSNDACKAQHFPRTDPVVIMLGVLPDAGGDRQADRILLGRQRQFLPGVYSALAGFMEPGESIEEAVRRELAEEAGLATGEVRYIASQPWPFPSSLMIGCVADATSDALTVDQHELEDARWFRRDEVTTMLRASTDMNAPLRLPPPLSLAHQITKRYLGMD
ncbi:NAD(+) diphosphatase [Ferrovibrio sp.]|uniref:NAD(+) diphosphatase n=1 Tax=Ferrovibrio sp. TaxID=1917215 RepID=UPI003D0ECA24